MFSVYLYDQRVGTIERRRGGIRFSYIESAVADDAMPALTVSLPKRREPYRDREAGPFFRNLLPEQAYRRLVTAAAGTDPKDPIGLLGAIGGECPGAVSIWPGDERPPETHEYQPLSDSQLAALFSPTGQPELGSAVTRGRLSLPGVQDKIALLEQDDGSWALPLGGAVTSHILKRPSEDFPELLENELFCMTLAARTAVAVPETGIAASSMRVFCAERFDRPMPDSPRGAPRGKIHQEDFCQILRVLPERKYERDGGPGIQRCAEVVRGFSALPAKDLLALLRWVGFNCLVGNEDAHAKNLAFLYEKNGLRLAPFYDLVCTEVYEGLERSLAMKVGSSWDVRDLKKSDWRRLAERVGVPWERARQLLLDLCATLGTVVGEAGEFCVERYGDADVYSRIAELVSRHARHMERELTP